MADLRSLTVLAAVVRHRSFTAAARELHVAQQAVSRTVARLETELGVTLVERSTRHVEPTAAGIALAADAEALTAAAETALARARELGGAPPAVLRVGVSPGVSQTEVSALFDSVRGALAGIELDVVESRPRAVAGQLRDGTADVVIARYPALGPDRQLVALGETEAGLAVPAGHPLTRRRKPVPLSALAGERLLKWSTRSRATDALESMLADIDVDWVVSTVVGRDGLADVAAGTALAIWTAADTPRPDVRLLRLDPPLFFPVTAVLRRGTPTATVRTALDAFQAALRSPHPPS